jgi:hypothetical protein
VRAHPALAGTVLAVLGILGNWAIARSMSSWPAWMLFPSVVLSVLAIVALILGLGLLVVRLLEPVIAVMHVDWGDEPLAGLGLPPALQRKCEQLGFWTAEAVVSAIDRGKFSWIALEYDERMQLERAAQRWRSASATAGKHSALHVRRTPRDRAHG